MTPSHSGSRNPNQVLQHRIILENTEKSFSCVPVTTIAPQCSEHLPGQSSSNLELDPTLMPSSCPCTVNGFSHGPILQQRKPLSKHQANTGENPLANTEQTSGAAVGLCPGISHLQTHPTNTSASRSANRVSQTRNGPVPRQQTQMFSGM